jgi:hypothetical protein
MSRNERLLRLLLQVSSRADFAWSVWASSCSKENYAKMDKWNKRHDIIKAEVLKIMDEGNYEFECTCNENHTCEAHRA